MQEMNCGRWMGAEMCERWGVQDVLCVRYEVCEMSCVREMRVCVCMTWVVWDELCKMSCVRGVLCEMSVCGCLWVECVRCVVREMTVWGDVWDGWDELCEMWLWLVSYTSALTFKLHQPTSYISSYLSSYNPSFRTHIATHGLSGPGCWRIALSKWRLLHLVMWS